MIKQTIKLVSIALIALNLSSCKTTQLQVQKPTETINKTTAEKVFSTVNLPISINLKNVEKEVNTQFKTTLYDDQSFENNNKDNLILRIDKRSNILVNTVDNKIQIKAPLFIKLKYKIGKEVMGVDLSHIQDANFNINVTAISKVEITKDWKIKIKTEPIIKWEDAPGSAFGIDLNKIIDFIIKQKIDDLSKMIEDQITKAIDVKQIISDNWKLIQQPIELDKTLKAWLYIQPQDVSITPFKCANNKIEFKTGLNSYIDIRIGDNKEEIKPKNLPSLKVENNLQDDISIALAFELPYSELNNIVNKQVKDSTFVFDNGKSTIKINNVEFFGSESNVMLGLDIDGNVKKGFFGKKIKGIVYLSGQPYYNPADKTISIKNFDFDLKSRDILLKSASWIIDNKKFRTNIESQLVFPISKE